MQISRNAMLASLAGVFALTGLAHAQFSAGAEGDRVLFEADTVTRADKTSPVIAEGNVKAYYGSRYVTADRLVYDPATDIVTAYGNVAVTDADGETIFADRAELTGDLAEGVAENFSAILADDSRLASATMVREGGNKNTLNKAVYTGCEVCDDDGDPKTPTWQLRAVRVVQDEENKVIRFHNAFFDVLGVPVLYTPYIQVPDPSVERKTGLLFPSFGTTTTQGFYYEQPLYVGLSDHQDLTFNPKYMELQGLLYQGEYRIKNHSGGMVLQGGIIDANEDSEYFISGSPGLNTPETRFHIFGEGYQDFADNWRASFDLNHVSDKRYLGIYDVRRTGDLAERTETFRPDRLATNLRVQRRTDDSLFSVESLTFKSLRSNEDNDYVGHALPRISYNGVFETPAIGGQTTVDGDFLSILRQDGLRTTRVVGSVNWSRRFTTRSGHLFETFGELRGDAYSYGELDQGNEFCNPSLLNDAEFALCLQQFPGGAEEAQTTTTRFLPTAGVEWNYPLAKQTDNATFIVEPQVQLVVSPEQDYLEDIVNEDSQFFQFDTNTLFRYNKTVGYDLWEDGTRANVGLGATAAYDNGLKIDGMIGQQFRAEESDVYSVSGLQTGLGETSSDIVGEFNLSYRAASDKRISFNNSFRVDKNDGSIKRALSQFSGTYKRFDASIDYLKLEQSPVLGQDEFTEFVTTDLGYEITEHWSVSSKVIHDLNAGENTKEQLSLVYRDDCTKVTVSYRNDPRRDLGFDFDQSISFKIELIGLAD